MWSITILGIITGNRVHGPKGCKWTPWWCWNVLKVSMSNVSDDRNLRKKFKPTKFFSVYSWLQTLRQPKVTKQNFVHLALYLILVYYSLKLLRYFFGLFTVASKACVVALLFANFRIWVYAYRSFIYTNR